MKAGQESVAKCSSFRFTGWDSSEESPTLSSNRPSRIEPQLPTAVTHTLTCFSGFLSSLPHSPLLHSCILESPPNRVIGSQVLVSGYAFGATGDMTQRCQMKMPNYIQKERNSIFNSVLFKGSSAPTCPPF